MVIVHRRRESGEGSWSPGWSLAGSLAIAAPISIGPPAAQEQALAVRDSNPWGYSAWPSELTAAGIPYTTSSSATLESADNDGDGFTNCDSPTDCHDFEADSFPGNVEICDFIDNACDGYSGCNGAALVRRRRRRG